MGSQPSRLLYVSVAPCQRCSMSALCLLKNCVKRREIFEPRKSSCRTQNTTEITQRNESMIQMLEIYAAADAELVNATGFAARLKKGVWYLCFMHTWGLLALGCGAYQCWTMPWFLQSQNCGYSLSTLEIQLDILWIFISHIS